MLLREINVLGGILASFLVLRFALRSVRVRPSPGIVGTAIETVQARRPPTPWRNISPSIFLNGQLQRLAATWADLRPS